MKTILVPLIGQHDLENPLEVERLALDAGFDLARRFEAHVKVVSLIDRPPASSKKWPIWWPRGGAGELLDWIDEVSEQRRKNAVAQYNAVVSAQNPQPLQTDSPTPGFTADFSEKIGEIVEMLGPICRLSDLVVTSSADTNWMGPFSPLVEEILRDAGKPLLVVPKDGAKAIGETVAIAWDGSAASARATAAAIPFLRQAREITVFSCDEGGKGDVDPADMVEYLEWHGLEAGSSHVKPGDQRPGPAIIDAARERNCNLVVLGACLHSRAHRLVYGSMTEYVVDQPRIAALLVP
jgi:nucleotide-binding universal stress UspA family protein